MDAEPKRLSGRADRDLVVGDEVFDTVDVAYTYGHRFGSNTTVFHMEEGVLVSDMFSAMDAVLGVLDAISACDDALSDGRYDELEHLKINFEEASAKAREHRHIYQHLCDMSERTVQS